MTPSHLASSPVRQRRAPLLPGALHFGLLLPILAGTAWAQSDAAGAADAKPATADVLTLSPFVVNTQKDTGFVASSSLAGGRLAGDLKDTPAAYSVQTREFIDALDLTDIGQASQWAVNAATLQDQGTTEIFGSPSLISIRGGSNASTQRDFFPFAVNYDSYNLERIDYARGPNAILFGNGDYSGTINAVSRAARVDKSFGELKASYGSWDNARLTVDANAATPNKRVAVRVDGVYQTRNNWRAFDWERRKAATAAATFNLTGSTQLRLQAETGDIFRNNPVVTFNDRFTGWDGKTTLAAKVPTTGLPGTATPSGYGQYGNATTPVFMYNAAFGGVMDVSRTGQTLGGNNSATVPVGGVLVVGPSANIAGQPIGEAQNLPDSRFAPAIAGSHFRVPGRDFAVSTNNPSFVQHFNAFSAFLTQSWGDHVFGSVDGNYSRERRITEYINSRGTPNTYIDINQNLADGVTANPEFLQPYNEGYRLRFRIGNTTKAVRTSLAYLTSKTRFGEFSLNGSWQYSKNEYIIDPLVYVVKRNADPRLWSNTGYNDALYFRHYWDQPDFPTPEVASVAYNGTTYAAGWVKDIANTSAVPSLNDTTLNTLQAAGKAKLLEGRLHFLAAVRHDDYTGSAIFSRMPGDYPANWDGGSYLWRSAAPADYAMLTYVPKDANGNPTGAARPATTRPRTGIVAQSQYANDRFQDDFSPPEVKVKQTTYSLGSVVYLLKSLGAFYNYSTTFNPSAARQSVFGSFYGPQVAQEWSAGLRESLAGGKLSLSLDYYKGHQAGQVFDQGLNPTTWINNIALASPTSATGPAPASGQGNIRGLAPVPRFFDRRDLSDHGWELEVVANPTRSWRVSFNAALPRAYAGNVAPDFIKYLNLNDTTLRQIAADTSVLIDPTSGNATVDSSVPTTRRSPDASGVATAWNGLQSQRANIVGGQQLVSRLPLYSLNLFTDYTFREGALKNFKVGAGYNYRARQAIGYRGADTIVDPNNPTSAIDNPSVSALDPVYARGYGTATAIFGYNFKVTPKYTLVLDLKIDNALNYDKPLYTSTVQRPANGDLTTPARVATPVQYFYLIPRNYTFSATVRF